MTAHAKTITAAAFLVAFFGAYAALSLRGSVFTDVPDDAPYASATADLQQRNLIQGYDDGTFKPDQTINRAEFVKIIAGAAFDLSSEEADQCMIRNRRGDTLLFPDVPYDAWYTRPLCIAFERRAIAGYPDGTFAPADDISFIEAAKILVVAYEPTVYPGKPDWYVPYMEKLRDWSAIPPSIVALNQKITRGEMADMTYRVLHAHDADGSDGTYVPDSSYETIPVLADPPPPPAPEEAASPSSEESSSTEEAIEPVEFQEESSEPESVIMTGADSSESSEAIEP